MFCDQSAGRKWTTSLLLVGKMLTRMLTSRMVGVSGTVVSCCVQWTEQVFVPCAKRWIVGVSGCVLWICVVDVDAVQRVWVGVE